MKELAIIAIMLLLGICLSACGASFQAYPEAGYAKIEGDAEGIRALSDWHVGQAAEVKASPDVKSSYWQLREKQSIRLLPRIGKKEASNGSK